MKNKKSFPNFFFRPNILSLIIVVLILFNTISQAQETPSGQDQFYIGTEFHNNTIEDTRYYTPFNTSGMNTLSQRVDDDLTWEYINGYNILACNVRYKTDWIAYYTTCYYSKWEAEVDADADRVGFKHRDSLGYSIGDSATWKYKSCWSSKGLLESRDSLMYGPHYRQDKRYKRGLYDNAHKDSVYYIPRFIMALDNHGNAGPNEDVCRIKVLFRYRLQDSYPQDAPPFIERTLKVSDFDTSGEFDEIYLHPNPDSGLYIYPDQFWLPKNIDNFPDVPSSVEYIDNESFTGIQYCVDWLGNDNLFTLYIDYVEVYDRDGWNVFMGDSLTAAQSIQDIKDYADSYNNTDWQNIKYWLGVDEPYSIDCYEPIRVVDEIVRSVDPNTPLNYPFNPTWHWYHTINGEDEVLQFHNWTYLDKYWFNYLPRNLIRQKFLKFENLK